MMMMMVKSIIYMMLNKKNPSITDRIIIHVINYYYKFTNDFCTILSIYDSATTATTTTTTTITTDANVVSNENQFTLENFFFLFFSFCESISIYKNTNFDIYIFVYKLILFSYHPQQQQQVPLPHMMQQPQQVHHLIPQSAGASTQNRDHHQHSHPVKEMNKPKGRMSAYTFFVQKCRDEHRKAYPNENANFSEFSKKCAEKWKVRRRRQR